MGFWLRAMYGILKWLVETSFERRYLKSNIICAELAGCWLNIGEDSFGTFWLDWGAVLDVLSVACSFFLSYSSAFYIVVSSSVRISFQGKCVGKLGRAASWSHTAQIA